MQITIDKPTPLRKPRCRTRRGADHRGSSFTVVVGRRWHLDSDYDNDWHNARDSTAEMQAYYAAEAGVARTLEVLRGNVESSPNGHPRDFPNVVCTKTCGPPCRAPKLTLRPMDRPGFKWTSIWILITWTPQ